MNNKLTIVIPIYNRAHLIGRCLESIEKQDLKNFDIILVDNNSTDGSKGTIAQWALSNGYTREILKSENHRFIKGGRSLIIISEHKQGAASARNAGLKACTTEFISFFDSDDEMKPNYAREIQEGLSKADVVIMRAEIVDGNGKLRLKRYGRRHLWRRQIFNSLISTLTFGIKKSVLELAGGWNPHAEVWDDWELGIRILLLNPRIKIIDKSLSKIHPQTESLTGHNFSHKAGKWEKSIEIARKAILRSSKIPSGGKLGKVNKNDLLKWLTYVEATLAANYLKEGKTTLSKEYLSRCLNSRELTQSQKRLLTFLYHYTSKGFRGAYLFWR